MANASKDSVLRVAKELGESRAGVLEQLTTLIETLGLQRVDALVLKAKKQMLKGSVSRKDGKGVRSLGGVFFQFATKELHMLGAKTSSQKSAVPKWLAAARTLERILRRAEQCHNVLLDEKRTANKGQVELRQTVKSLMDLAKKLEGLLPPLRPTTDVLQRHGDDPKEWLPRIGFSKATPLGSHRYRAQWIGGGMSN